MHCRSLFSISFVLPFIADFSYLAIDSVKKNRQIYSPYISHNLSMIAQNASRNQSIEELYRQVVEKHRLLMQKSEERERVLMQQYEESLPPAERRLLQLERAELRKWRFYGNCAYNWYSWKLDSKTGVRSTEKTCDSPESMKNNILGRTFIRKIYVRCEDLKVSPVLSFAEELSSLPTYSDRQMVLALCGSVKNLDRD